MKIPRELWMSISLAVIVAGIGTMVWCLLTTYGGSIMDWFDR